MRELTFIGPHHLEWRERPEPVLQSPGDALVRPLAVARCDLDLVIVRGHFPMRGPFAVGHEFVARVLAIGDAVTRVKPGDVVCVPFQIGCGICERCRRGFTGSCSAVPFLSAFGLGPLSGREWGGALSDVVRIPFADAMLLHTPDGASPSVLAAASDNIVDGYRLVAESLARTPSAPVLVAGGGAPSIGLYAVASARALGASEIVYVDDSSERLAIAEQLGARVIEERIREDLRIGRYPITVDATASPEALRFVLRSTELEGTCTSAGIFGEVTLPFLELYTRGIRLIIGRAHARAALADVLELIGKGALRIETIVTKRARWDDAIEAWSEPATKLVVEREAA